MAPVRVVPIGRGGLLHDLVDRLLVARNVEDQRTSATVVVLVEPTDEDWDRARDESEHLILLTERSDRDLFLDAVLRGARAVLGVDAPSTQIRAAIDTVAAGGSWFDPVHARTLADELRYRAALGEGHVTLTKRENDILASVAGGSSVKQTALELGISLKTVENLQTRLFRKLGVRNRAQAVAKAHEIGLLAAGG